MSRGGLVGRSAEIAAIEAGIAGLARSQPFVVALAGDEGSGRSALVALAVDRARAAGATVLAARGTTGEPAPAYSGLLGLLRPIEARLDDLAGRSADAVHAALALTSPAVAVTPADVGLGVLRVLGGLAERAPVVVAIDDADVVDAASIGALTFAVSRFGLDPVGVVIATTTGPSPWDGVVTTRLALAPLTARQLARVVADAVDCTADVSAACAGWAAGNPLLAIELARSLSDDERQGRVPLPAVPSPAVRAVQRLQSRLDALPEPGRRAAVVVAAAGEATVATVTGALAALRERPGGLGIAEAGGVVRVVGDEVSFTHPLLQPLAYHLVAAASRRSAHRAIAHGLTEPWQAARRAWHLVASCAGPDEEVAAALDLVAADARRRGALAESAAALERAAVLTPDPSRRAERRRQAAIAHLDGYDFDAALALVDPADSADGESARLGLEALEGRDGPVAALAALAAAGPAARPDAGVRADVLLGAGRRAEAAAALAGAPVDVLTACVGAALDPAAALPDEPDDPSARGRRARRRWLLVAAGRGVATSDPTTVDELAATATVRESAGDVAGARDLLERAAAAVPTGAVRLAAELDRRIAALEESAAADAPASALDELTKAERRVAESVAGGRTNREVADHLFVSVKTVDFHLQSIYRKLNVRSRTELAVLVAGIGVGREMTTR